MREGTREEGRIDNAIGGGLHRWPLFESAICIYLGPLFEPWEIHGAEGGAREKDERIYSENKAKGERGPLVVTELFYVSVEKKKYTARRGSKFRSVSLIDLFRELEEKYIKLEEQYSSQVANYFFLSIVLSSIMWFDIRIFFHCMIWIM